MNKRLNIKFVIVIGMVALLLSGCFNANDSDGSMEGMDHSNMDSSAMDGKNIENMLTAKTATLTGTEFTLIAQTSNFEITSETTLPVWTFNNSVPGPEIRVKQGEIVKINLQNELPDPVTIHWHGLPVPNLMDGVPGITQNAVQPGESFTYEFKAEVPGTYWYHSHQDGVNQVDKGLYGSFIVEAKGNEVDQDYTLVLDEWISSGTSMDMSSMDHSQMNTGPSDDQASEDNAMMDMDHREMNRIASNNESAAEIDHGNMEMTKDTTEMEVHDMSMYDLFTINGKSGASTQKIIVTEGEKVRIRLINAGFMSHNIHLHGHKFKVTATDGQPINNPGTLKDQLFAIAPGERYDIEFVANNPGEWYLEAHGNNPAVKGMKTLIQYEGVESGNDEPNETEMLPFFDLSSYGQSSKSSFMLEQKYDLEYTMDLNTEQREGDLVYTINGKTSPDTEKINVQKGDKVKVRLVNNSKFDDHPMHLHGHFFQVLSKNGEPIEGSPIIKDTLNLKPGEEYVVAFEADNPGDWMFHCHDLHHASAGMMTQLQYPEYDSTFVPDPEAGNNPS